MFTFNKTIKLILSIILGLLLIGCSSRGGRPAPRGIDAEPAYLFSYEHDDENGGVRLIRYQGENAVVRVPDSIGRSPVVGIGPSCFEMGTTTDVYFPGTVKYFEWGLRRIFDIWHATEIIIPEGVTTIVSEAFIGAASLISIEIPDSVTTIGMSAFLGCRSLTSVKLPNGISRIPVSAFENCASLLEVTIPESVTVIGTRAFYRCSSLTRVTLPEGLVSISLLAFAGCSSLVDINIPDSLTEIADYAFAGCDSLPEETRQKIRQINPMALSTTF